MTYSLEFVESALKEWRKLSADIRNQLKNKLSERLTHPHVPASRLHGLPDCYKIKLRASGFRLVYQVHDKASKGSQSEQGVRSSIVAFAASKGSGLAS